MWYGTSDETIALVRMPRALGQKIGKVVIALGMNASDKQGRGGQRSVEGTLQLLT